MNRTKLKNYAPQARREFIQAVTDRSAVYGLTAEKIEQVTERGDVAIIAGRAFPRSVVAKRRALAERIRQNGFGQTMEAMAYTWFNRLVAIRFMEIHGYLEHGYRVLSNPNPEKTVPEILEHAEHIDLPGLDRNKVVDLKLGGTQDNELYRMLLIAQCNALQSAMPFLFERIDDETELLLPDNLLHSDSLIRKLVNDIEEQDWQEVEIIGWLYQFYISEKKDEVIGKAVKSEDIPAATQRFTPNWIAKYLVQNTLGRQWLATYPDSPLCQQMQYYIGPAKQTDDVKAQLAAITPNSLDPEKLTLLDDACGSGHILVEAYDLFKAIYQERGYRNKDIPRLILEKNLFGLEIDDRAAQLAGFALLMKARADDRRIFADRIQPNVIAIQGSKGLEQFLLLDGIKSENAEEMLLPDNSLFSDMRSQPPLKIRSGKSPLASVETYLRELINLFEHGKTFGSLIRVPPKLAAHLQEVQQTIDRVLATGNMVEQSIARAFLQLVRQAEYLAKTYDNVVTNPPYMGSKFYNSSLKEFVNSEYADFKQDLYSCFLFRCSLATKEKGSFGLITIPNWMFLSSFEKARLQMKQEAFISCLLHNGRGVFGSDFGSCAFVFVRLRAEKYSAKYIKLFSSQGEVSSSEEISQRLFVSKPFIASLEELSAIPGCPIAYWVDAKIRNMFARKKRLDAIYEPRQGLATANDDLYLRRWYEVDIEKSWKSDTPNKTWYPFTKGGNFRKWFGNNEYVINWRENGKAVRSFENSVIRNDQIYFRPHITWTSISISKPSFRFGEDCFVIGHRGPAIVHRNDSEEALLVLIGFLNSCVSSELLKVTSQTVTFEVGHIAKLPLVLASENERSISRQCIEIAKQDWDNFEISWDFQTMPLLSPGNQGSTVIASFAVWESQCNELFRAMKVLEEDNNQQFITAYGLEEELSFGAPEDQITLGRPDREQDMKRLISYSIGCVMGRYSLDKPGLVYAHSHNEGFEPSQYRTFPADTDGIIPITELTWFPDDATERFVEFIAKAWPREHLEENLKFIADSLGQSGEEHSRDIIRRYLATGFYKDHLQTYKRRPIYWLCCSGKQKAFQCLVYLHRYHEGTLARMRTEYVIPLQGQISARIDQLASDAEKAASTSHRKKLEKERDKLLKQQAELQQFDEKLRHYADMRIGLDLDDGVKVNYGKFGDLLAEVKAVTGGTDE